MVSLAFDDQKSWSFTKLRKKHLKHGRFKG